MIQKISLNQNQNHYALIIYFLSISDNCMDQP